MKKKTIIIYRPRAWTRALHESKNRWNVVVAHRRSGKTTAALNHLVRDALRIVKSRYAFIAPTYKQAKNVAWDILKDSVRKIEGIKINESELRVDFANGSRITLYGADNPDSLRGIALWGVVFDEYSQQPASIFSEIIRPALSDHEGYAIWIGTPKGKNEFYKLYLKAKESPKWTAIYLQASKSGIVSEGELEDARASMSLDEYNQEYECSFIAGIKGAYYIKELSEARAEGRICKVPYDRTIPVNTVWDLGVADKTSIIFYQVLRNEIRIIDHYTNNDEALSHYVQVLQNKGYVYREYWLPWDARAKSLQTNMSLVDQLAKLGVRARIVPNISVNAGISMVREIFNRLWINEGLESFIESISLYRREWDEKRGEFRNRPLHDKYSHDADALRYLALVCDKTARRQSEAKTGLRTSRPKKRLKW